MATTYRLRNSSSKRAISNHRTKSGAVSAGKKRVVKMRTKGIVAVDKCVKPAKGRATCEVVTKINAVEEFKPNKPLKTRRDGKWQGRWIRKALVEQVSASAPAPKGETAEVLNGARTLRRR